MLSSITERVNKSISGNINEAATLKKPKVKTNYGNLLVFKNSKRDANLEIQKGHSNA